MNFVHLNVRSSYSIGYSILRIEDIFNKAREYGQKAVALTDMANLSGVPEFLRVAQKYPDIKPIIGLSMPMHVEESGFSLSAWFTFLAKDLDGYKGLVEISSSAINTDNYYKLYNFKCDDIWGILSQYSDHIICMCNISFLPSYLKAKDETPYDIERKTVEGRNYLLNKFKVFFGDDFYLEVLARDCNEDYLVKVDSIARLLGIKPVATNKIWSPFCHLTILKTLNLHTRIRIINYQ